MRWGQEPPQNRKRELEERVHAWTVAVDHERRPSPFARTPEEIPGHPQALSGADVYWLAVCALAPSVGSKAAAAALLVHGSGDPSLDLSGLILTGANLHLSDLRCAVLRGAHLERTLLVGAHFDGADLSYTHLEGAYMSQSHLAGARLEGTHLDGASMRETLLDEDADGRRAALERISLLSRLH